MLLLWTGVGALFGALLFLVIPVPFTVLNAVPPLTLAFVWPLTCVLANYNYASAVAEHE